MKKYRYRWFVINQEGQILTQNNDWLTMIQAPAHYPELVRNGSPLRVLAELKTMYQCKWFSKDSLLGLRLIHLPTATELWPTSLAGTPFLVLGLLLRADNQLLAANFTAGRSYQIRI